MNINNEKSSVGCVATIIAAIIAAVVTFLVPVMIFGVLYYGWAISVCWNLVIVKTFPAVPHLTWASGAGIAAIIGVIRGNHDIKNEYRVFSTNVRNIIGLFTPLIGILMCWILANFIH